MQHLAGPPADRLSEPHAMALPYLHSPAMPPLRAALGLWLAGRGPADPPGWLAGDLEALAWHGLDGVAAALLARGCAGDDAAEAGALRRRRAALAAAELAARPALDAALHAMQAAGIDALLIKGEALARTLYRDAGTRVRGDADLWVRAAAFDRAEQVLAGSGWRVQPSASGEWLQPERTWVAASGVARIDLHRRVLAQPLLAAALDFDTLRGRAVVVDRIRMPDAADALVLAALHLYGHHADQPRGIWLFDVDRLLASAPQVLASAVQRACGSGVACLLQEALMASHALFGTPLDATPMQQLADHARHEPAARLLQPMSARRRLWFDFRTLPGLPARARWLRELLLPDAGWLRAREGRGPLPWLYLRRAWRGWVRRA